MSNKLREEIEQLKKQVATLKRELEYAWATLEFSDHKGYYTQADGWFDHCWEYRDIGAADYWLQDCHDIMDAKDLTEEELNKFGLLCTEQDYCPVCIKLAEE
jgi:hypothetical protein